MSLAVQWHVSYHETGKPTRHMSPSSEACSEEREVLCTDTLTPSQPTKMGTNWLDVSIVIQNWLPGTVESLNEAHSKYKL